MSNDIAHLHVVETERIGKLNVYVQGDLDHAHKGEKPVFFTVHDIGKNHNEWVNFVLHPAMNNVRERSVFIHVDLLGQEDDAEDMSDAVKFPCLQTIGEDLVNILDNLRIKSVIGLGDGAGANIMARFLGMHSTRCMGAVLINPTASAASFIEQFKDKIATKFHKFDSGFHPDLVLHRFGYKLEDISDDAELSSALTVYQTKIHETKLNQKNAKHYIDAFMQRDDITSKLRNYHVDMLLVCGAKSAYVPSMEYMFSLCDKTKVSNIKLDEVGDVLEEAPVKLAQSLLLFSKGQGWLTSLATAGVEQKRSASQSSLGSGDGHAQGRRISMEEYDRPNIRRLSVGNVHDEEMDRD